MEINEDNGLTVKDDFEPITIESLTPKQEGKEDDNIKFDGTFLPKDINKDFIKLVKPLFGFNKVFRFWGIVRNAIREVHYNHEILSPNDFIDIVIDVFKRTVFGYKQGFVKKFEGYFFIELCKELAANSRKQAKQQPHLSWLQG